MNSFRVVVKSHHLFRLLVQFLEKFDHLDQETFENLLMPMLLFLKK